MSFEEFQIQAISCRLDMSTRKNPEREESKEEHGRDDVEDEGLVEELPENGDIVVPANVRDQEVGELDGGKGLSGGVQIGIHLNRPNQRITPLLLRRLCHLLHLHRPLATTASLHQGFRIRNNNNDDNNMCISLVETH